MPIYNSGTVAVTVPAITDPDLNSVDVVLTTAQGVCNVGDFVLATPVEALSATTLFVGAYVTAAQTIRCVFGSVGGNVVSAPKNFKFQIIYS